MRTILLLTFFICSYPVYSQKPMQASYQEFSYTTASGVPLVFADPKDTSRRRVLAQCICVVMADSLFYQYHETSDKCGQKYSDTVLIFGNKASHHEVFYDLRNSKGYEYRQIGLARNKFLEFKKTIQIVNIIQSDQIISGIKCIRGYFLVGADRVDVLVSSDDRYPSVSYFRGLVLPGLLVEMSWPKRGIYATLTKVEFADFQIVMPKLKIHPAKTK